MLHLCNNFTPQITQRLSQPVSKLTNYSGFIPNEVFKKLTPSQTLVYCVVQFLSFFRLEVTPKTIKKYLVYIPLNTVRNCLHILVREKHIKKHQDYYLFLDYNNPDKNTREYLTAKEIAPSHGSERKGYWLPLSILESYKLKPIDCITFSVIQSFIGKKPEAEIRMAVIEKRIHKKSAATSRSVNRLEDQGYIARRKDSLNSPFHYRLGGRNMSKHNTHTDVDNLTKCTDSDTPNRTDSDMPISINKSNYSYRETRVDNNEPASLELVKNDSLISLKEIVSHFEQEASTLERKISDDERRNTQLKAEFGDAVDSMDYEKSREIGSQMTAQELRGRGNGDMLARAVGVTTNHLHVVKANNLAEIGQSDIQQIGKAAKALLPDFDSPGMRKKAFCLLMNSMLCDLRLEFHRAISKKPWHMKSREQIAMHQAVSVCLRKASSAHYKINDDIALEFYRSKGKTKHKVEVGKGSYHWLN